MAGCARTIELTKEDILPGGKTHFTVQIGISFFNRLIT